MEEERKEEDHEKYEDRGLVGGRAKRDEIEYENQEDQEKEEEDKEENL